MKYLVFAPLLLVFLLLPLQIGAAIGVPFGGHVIATIPCTCSGGQVVTFDRFFGASLPGFGVSVFYQPPAPVFSRFSLPLFPILPATWLLGAFTPGVPAVCMEGIPPACVPIPTPPVLGIINYTGISGPTIR
jgi:hypothetical protein